jgi:Leucine-rich repeat (LRR) protein
MENFQIDGIDFKNLNFDAFKLLEEVHLENNLLTHLPAQIFNLKKIKKFVLMNQPMKDIYHGRPKTEDFYKCFKNWPELNYLTIESMPLRNEQLLNTSSDKKIQLFELPSNVETLKIRNLPLDTFPFDLSDCAMSLKSLEFSGFQWIVVNSGNQIVTFKELKKKFHYVMTLQEAIDWFRRFDTDGNHELNAQENFALSARIFLDYPRLSVKTTEQASFGAIPPVIFTLKNLKSLNLSYQGITKVPDEIGELTELEELILDECVLLETISGRISYLKQLKTILLNNCLSLKTPPPEICRRGTQAILAYMNRLVSGSVKCQRTKLMLVGLGEAGKTSLVRSLINYNSYYSISEIGLTDGIDIKDWHVSLQDNSTLTYSVWDFGN